MLLGPSLLGSVGGEFYGAVFTASVAPIMSMLGELRLVLLMSELSLHLDLEPLRESARMRIPVALALMGIAAPFIIKQRYAPRTAVRSQTGAAAVAAAPLYFC